MINPFRRKWVGFMLKMPVKRRRALLVFGLISVVGKCLILAGSLQDFSDFLFGHLVVNKYGARRSQGRYRIGYANLSDLNSNAELHSHGPPRASNRRLALNTCPKRRNARRRMAHEDHGPWWRRSEAERPRSGSCRRTAGASPFSPNAAHSNVASRAGARRDSGTSSFMGLCFRFDGSGVCGRVDKAGVLKRFRDENTRRPGTPSKRAASPE